MNLKSLKKQILKQMPDGEAAIGESLFLKCDCQMLSQSAVSVDFIIDTAGNDEPVEYSLIFDGSQDKGYSLIPAMGGKTMQWDRYSYACLLQYEQELSVLDPKEHIEHKKYTRRGMIKRVLDERRQKADKAAYRIQWADNIYGDHTLTNETGVKYKIFLRDFENETGYSDSPDSKFNKLGTTKHIMFAFSQLKKNKGLFNRLGKTYPFIEIFCDPLNDNKITWMYPHELPDKERLLISRHFKRKSYIENNDSDIKAFLGFIENAAMFETICIRPEAVEKVERAFEQSLLKELEQTYVPDFSCLRKQGERG